MHDKNGNPIKVGDRVTVEAEILETSANEEFCNARILIGEKDQPHGANNVTSNIWVNAKQTELIGESEVDRAPVAITDELGRREHPIKISDDLTDTKVILREIIAALDASEKKSRYRSLVATHLEIAEGFLLKEQASE